MMKDTTSSILIVHSSYFLPENTFFLNFDFQMTFLLFGYADKWLTVFKLPGWDFRYAVVGEILDR